MSHADDRGNRSVGSHEWATEQVKKRIQSWNLPDEFKDVATERANDFLKIFSLGHSWGQYYRGYESNWVIKNDDLDLIGRLGPSAIAIVTYFAVPATSLCVVAFGLLLGVLNIRNALHQKGIHLEPEDFRVLMPLRQKGPSPVEEIAIALGGIHIFGNELWDKERTLVTLKRLESVRQNDGTLVHLVNESSDGLWAACGV